MLGCICLFRNLLFKQRTCIQFSAPKLGSSQLPVTPTPGDDSPDLLGHLHLHAHPDIHIHTHTTPKFFKQKQNKKNLVIIICKFLIGRKGHLIFIVYIVIQPVSLFWKSSVLKGLIICRCYSLTKNGCMQQGITVPDEITDSCIVIIIIII